MFKTVLVANRGEIAGRVIHTLQRMGIRAVAVHSDADRFTQPVRLADAAVRLGPAPASQSYLDVEAVIAACQATGAEAVHPGYGFLSENADFAERLAAAGIAFIGPTPEQIRAFGLKHTARALAEANGVPLLRGSGLLDSAKAALDAAAGIGYPVMLKSTAGGGGIGMVRCATAEDLASRFAGVERMAQASFGDARLYVERAVDDARHVEVQIFGNGQGRVVALGERDCSLQRRHQKVVEETPAPNLGDDVRRRLHAAAVRLGESVRYLSAGTVEFIYDPAREDFAFLEVNTRLQVEHPVTECVAGIDLVEWMVRQAAGEDMTAAGPLVPHGHAIEARLYAEMPHADFRPSAGLLTEVQFPVTVRVDTWVETGTEVTPYYDPLLAKIIVAGPSRAEAIAALRSALDATAIGGIETNLDHLRAIAASDLFGSGKVATTALASLAHRPRSIEVLEPGAQSSVQELPGRLGLWNVGVPPSGPMDARSFARANALVGNARTTTALELTVSGPTLRFHADAVVALSGARMPMRVGERAVPHDAPFPVAAGDVLTVGAIEGAGQRAYLAVRGGFAAPVVLGSRATFALGAFGGHATGVLKTGDVLYVGHAPPREEDAPEPAPLTHDWTLSVVYGPHGAPDFFQEEDIADLFASAYTVHFNSARTGVRLVGPTPRWARKDGGEAGLHPSNLHDNAYAVGAIDFTGDMPILLGPDGPSLGGFVCPAVVTDADQWKIGQLRPGDRVRFAPVAQAGASEPADAAPPLSRPAYGRPIVAEAAGAVPVAYRRQGDSNLLVEYGPMVLDIALRLRVHLLAAALTDANLPGIIDLTPGIRSLQVHFDRARLPQAKLLDALRAIEGTLPDATEATVPSRIVHLPLSWNDPEAERAMRQYQALVRPDAPWCPSNIEFIRRINGLADEEAVRRIVFAADYLVMGLGDVYLGAPVATPLDPRHRLVTTKYNPARTWTPENAVGIGGAYLCIYGMEGPGGYQLFGRTIQVWNTWRRTAAFRDAPWLLRPFDRIRFHPVDAPALVEARAAFPHGAYPIAIEDGTFSYADYARDLAANAGPIEAAQARQRRAFAAERDRWKAEGLDAFVAAEAESEAAPSDRALPAGCTAIATAIPGSVWKLMVEPGALIAAGATVAILESMKMEVAVTSPVAGRIVEVRTAPGKALRHGDVVAVVRDS